MKKLFLTVALCIGTAACVGVKAQDEVVMAETELKNEVIEMPEIGVKIVWDAGNEKLFILGSNRADVRSLSLDGECSVAKPDTGVRILYETTFGAAMPLYEQMRPKLSDDEFEDISQEKLEKSCVGDVVSDAEITLSARKNADGTYSWIMAGVSVYFGEILLDVYRLDKEGETVFFSKDWLRAR